MYTIYSRENLDKIVGITTYVLKVPLGEKQFFSSQCAFPERNSFLVRIDTDEGIHGWGEGGQYGPAEPLAALANELEKNNIKALAVNYRGVREPTANKPIRTPAYIAGVILTFVPDITLFLPRFLGRLS